MTNETTTTDAVATKPEFDSNDLNSALLDMTSELGHGMETPECHRMLDEIIAWATAEKAILDNLSDDEVEFYS